MIRDKLTEKIEQSLRDARDAGELQFEEVPEFALDPPKNHNFGDLSANVALVMAPQAAKPPRELARIIVEHLDIEEIAEKVDIAGAGFINFYLKPQWLHDVIRRIQSEGDGYGTADVGKGVKVQVEFVSANPNGPITIAHGRGGVIGDVIASLYEAVGYDVTRETYINDAPNSTQMQNFGKSVHARYMQALGEDYPMPEDGYRGDYVADIAEDIVAEHGDKFLSMSEEERIAAFTRLAEEEMLDSQRRDLEKFGIAFDVWFSERGLHESGKVQQVIGTLKEKGYAYERDGALWLKSTEFGDDKDRTLVRSNGQPTYIAADAAYHLQKFERGFEQVVDVWGPDHHGYVARTKASVAALGGDPNKLNIIIYQAVRLFSGGEIVMMSKRAGDVILLSELLDEVGKDAARFFFLMRSSDSTLDFDLGLAKSESADNPVYYVQYAHARISSILRNAEENGVDIPDSQQADLTPLKHEAEKDLIKKLSDYPDVVLEAAQLCEPHRITSYARELAAVLHSFYGDCRVLSDDKALTAARLVLLLSTRTVLANALRLCGVSAPERM